MLGRDGLFSVEQPVLPLVPFGAEKTQQGLDRVASVWKARPLWPPEARPVSCKVPSCPGFVVELPWT